MLHTGPNAGVCDDKDEQVTPCFVAHSQSHNVCASFSVNARSGSSNLRLLGPWFAGLLNSIFADLHHGTKIVFIYFLLQLFQTKKVNQILITSGPHYSEILY